MTMRASIIIAAHNEGDSLWKTVQSCLETSAGLDCEIIVADDASFDGSIDEVQRRFPQVRVVRRPRPDAGEEGLLAKAAEEESQRQGTSPTNDFGARSARGEVLVFLDGHCKPEPGALVRMVEDVERLKGRAVITPMIPALDERRWRRVPGQIGHGYGLDLKEFHCDWIPLHGLRGVQEGPRKFYESPAAIGCALAVHRELYQAVWGLDPHMRSWGAEDLDFSLKCWLMGFRVLHDPEAIVAHRFQRRFDRYEVPLEHYVVNQLRMARKNFTHGTWTDWLDRCRLRHSSQLANHPEGLWARIWMLFEEDRLSVEQERAHLLGHRERDEFWYADRFGLTWPRLSGPAGTAEEPSAPAEELAEFTTLANSQTPPGSEPDYTSPATCEMDGACCPPPDDSSDSPIRYFNGEVQLAVIDLSAGGYGKPWEHRRIYSNRLSSDADVGNGYNWLVEKWPYIIEHSDDSIAVVRGTQRSLWFDLVDGSYVGRFGAKSTLTHDTTNNLFVLTLPDGERYKLHDYDQTTYPAGLLASHESQGGQVTEVTSYTADDQIEEIQRSVTVDSTTTTESFRYTYNTDGQTDSVTLRRQVDGGGWNDVRRALYEYYGSSESYGSQGDLKRVRIQVPEDSTWANHAIHYYRYYKSGEARGFEHGLKYEVRPKAYDQMTTDGLDPLSATNGQIAQYADHYFEYNDADRRATKEAIDGGSVVYSFSFTTSTHADGYNNWTRKTVETRPGGSQNIVYTNYIGQILVKELTDGTNSWIEYRKYDSDGREIEYAEPSAVLGYDDTQADLAVTLKASDGLIHVTDYYATTGSGAAAGYVQFEKIKRGSGGTEVKLRGYEYASHTGGGATMHPISKQLEYRNDDGTGAIETSYSYSFHSGTVQMQERVTTLPAVPTSQNGSGVSDTRSERFDIHGNLTWQMDERGFITRFDYDLATGGVLQRIDDVQTSQTSDEPTGWSTPSGGGLHLVSDYEVDDLGRMTQQLDPEHTIDIGGVATRVRRATWTVYRDEVREVRTGQGYYDVSAASYTLVNPVSITKRDGAANVLEEIQAVRATTSGRLTASDSFAQSDYSRWTTFGYTHCCLLASQRVYHTIPGTGEGSSRTNYDETVYGYDSLKRRNRSVSSGGTIHFDVLDVRSQVVDSYVGTDDSGSTESDPTGGGASGNNMVLVTANQYDGGAAGGDGNLTKETEHVDGSTTRVTEYAYDWRNRQTDIDGEIDRYEKQTFDNLGRVTQSERFDTTASGNLVSREETKYDDRGRTYQRIRHEVDPASGTVGNSLIDNTWYDASGHPIKQLSAGSNLFTKTVYDGAGRQTKQYVGYDLDETTYSEAGNVTGDTVLEQIETDYDDAGNAIQTTSRQRYHNATGTGELTSPSGIQPKARVTYVASWQDALGRAIATADYGTNGGSALSRPSTVPSRSDTVLVNSTEYNSDGEAFKSVDSASKEDRTEFDDGGRRTKEIENYVDGNPSTGASDEDVTVEMTYQADGGMATLTAKNSETGDQVTQYVYGTTLSDSSIARSDLLRAEIYPESDDVASPLGNGPDGIYDRIEYKYNRQGQRTEVKDQRETVRSFDYDKLGRQTQDRITTLGSGVDGTVRRITTTYDVRGLRKTVTSYDNATVGAGSVVNELELAYNGFSQLVTEYEEHSGAVNPSTTPKVQYAYADGSDNHIRPTAVIYPDGRTIDYDYGSASGIDDAASRVLNIKDGTVVLASYSYLGRGTTMEVDYSEPDLRYTLVDLSGSDDPDTGDIYSGLDRFGRVKDSRWYDYAGSIDIDRIKYGYDRASNRIFREVVTDPNDAHDELYAYDGTHQLSDFDRGSLNSAKDAISSLQLAQQWSLDPTGNWSGFKEDADGDSTWDLDQSRSHNPVNEITDITETAGSAWATPAHDRAGNVTTLPQPADPTQSYSGVWDGWNRLVKLVDDATSNTVQENADDGRKFRIVRKDYSGGTLDETRHFYYTDQWQAIEERLGSSTDADRQFIWGRRYIDELVLRDRDTTANGALDERLYALQDGNWNVTAVADPSGTVEERYAYTAYGEPQYLNASYAARTGSSYGWGYLYTGRYLDAASGLYYFRNRMYHAKLGRFASRDPIGYEGSPWNLYECATSSPPNATDPSGFFPWMACPLWTCVADTFRCIALATDDRQRCIARSTGNDERQICNARYAILIAACVYNGVQCSRGEPHVPVPLFPSTPPDRPEPPPTAVPKPPRRPKHDNESDCVEGCKKKYPGSGLRSKRALNNCVLACAFINGPGDCIKLADRCAGLPAKLQETCWIAYFDVCFGKGI